MKFTVPHQETAIWAQPDFAVIHPDKRTYTIYDRKTGRVADKSYDTISPQLHIYALKVLTNLNATLDQIDIFCEEVFVKDMSSFGGKISSDAIKHIE